MKMDQPLSEQPIEQLPFEFDRLQGPRGDVQQLAAVVFTFNTIPLVTAVDEVGFQRSADLIDNATGFRAVCDSRFGPDKITEETHITATFRDGHGLKVDRTCGLIQADTDVTEDLLAQLDQARSVMQVAALSMINEVPPNNKFLEGLTIIPSEQGPPRYMYKDPVSGNKFEYTVTGSSGVSRDFQERIFIDDNNEPAVVLEGKTAITFLPLL